MEINAYTVSNSIWFGNRKIRVGHDSLFYTHNICRVNSLLKKSQVLVPKVTILDSSIRVSSDSPMRVSADSYIRSALILLDPQVTSYISCYEAETLTESNKLTLHLTLNWLSNVLCVHLFDFRPLYWSGLYLNKILTRAICEISHQRGSIEAPRANLSFWANQHPWVSTFWEQLYSLMNANN